MARRRRAATGSPENGGDDDTPARSFTEMSAFGGHPLHLHVPTFRRAARTAAAAGAPAEASHPLAGVGITDAEQLVAAASTNTGREGLAATLGVTTTQLDAIVRDARSVLPPPLAERLSHPLPAKFALGALRPEDGEDDAEYAGDEGDEDARAAAAGTPLPASVNLSSKMSPIRNQGGRGTCVSFTLTAINEYYRRVQGAPIDLSEQHLYDEMKRLDPSTGCGTLQRYGARVLRSRGECRETVWPYNPNKPCNNNGTMPPNARTDAASYKVSIASVGANNVTAIKRALAGRRPVGISIPVFDSWYESAETERSGRITMPLANEANDGGHALCAVGYQDDATSPGGGYFVVRNHWSTSWGYQCPYGPGYGVIPYQYVSGFGWEAYALNASVGDDEPEPAPREETTRTLTITVRGNVNLVIE